MKKIYAGLHTFHKSYFREEKEFFQRIAKKQSPSVFFVTCADSRVDPNLVTQSRPGELFIVRNMGNIIPPYTEIKDKHSVAAAMEFAVLELKVDDIIICGHSNCGAIQSLHRGVHTLTHMPHLREWLQLAQPIMKAVEPLCQDASLEECLRAAEQANILYQLENIQTYPFVKEALEQGSLHIHGWYYDIGTGEIYSYSPVDQMFTINLSEVKEG
jgi:carbonic anhydrase